MCNRIFEPLSVKTVILILKVPFLIDLFIHEGDIHLEILNIKLGILLLNNTYKSTEQLMNMTQLMSTNWLHIPPFVKSIVRYNENV